METDTPFVALDSTLIFRARYEQIRGHDHFRQCNQKTQAQLPTLIYFLSGLSESDAHLQLNQPPAQQPIVQKPTSPTTSPQQSTSVVVPKKRSRVANRGDAFPSDVQDAHDEHELLEQYRRADEMTAATATAAAAAAVDSRRRTASNRDNADDDVDDKLSGAAKRSRQQAGESANNKRRSNDDNDSNVDDDIDDDNLNGDDEDSSLASDELDDGRPKFYVGMAMGTSTIRLVCQPSSLRELRQIHGAHALANAANGTTTSKTQTKE